MRTILIASALSFLAVVPASAQSCVSGGAFVPCPGGGMGMAPGMGGGMSPGMQQPAGGPGMAPGSRAMAPGGMAQGGMMEDEPRARRSSKRSRRATR